MKKWMPLRGTFTQDGENIVFQGVTQPSDANMSTLFANQIIPEGIILFEDMISSGVIEANVKFEKFEKGDLAQIVFNYQNDFYYLCAGIANTLAKYSFNLINGQPSTIYATGYMDELPTTEFDIKLQLTGSFLELYINGIKVLASVVPVWINRTQVGILVKSREKVTIRNFKTNYKFPDAFIVSQFGDNYDVLYNQVIKPVCDKLKYNPIRGDEVASCTLILNDIITSIRDSAVIIADITPDNPNVFYELGYAHALGKPTILLCEKKIREKLPFDVSGFRTIFYDNSIGGKKEVEDKLEKHLQDIENSTYMGLQ